MLKTFNTATNDLVESISDVLKEYDGRSAERSDVGHRSTSVKGIGIITKDDKARIAVAQKLQAHLEKHNLEGDFQMVTNGRMTNMVMLSNSADIGEGKPVPTNAAMAILKHAFSSDPDVVRFTDQHNH